MSDPIISIKNIDIVKFTSTGVLSELRQGYKYSKNFYVIENIDPDRKTLDIPTLAINRFGQFDNNNDIVVILKQDTTALEKIESGFMKMAYLSIQGNFSLNHIIDGHVCIVGDASRNFITGSKGFDRLWGGGGDDVISSGPGPSVLRGNDGNDRLYGSNSKDYLNGDAGNDTLEGFAGDDELNGDAGDDELWGRQDDDTYVFSKDKACNWGNDVINDWEGYNKVEFIGDADPTTFVIWKYHDDLVIKQRPNDENNSIKILRFFDDRQFSFRSSESELRASIKRYKLSTIDQKEGIYRLLAE